MIDLKTSETHPVLVLRTVGNRHDTAEYNGAASLLEAYETAREVTFAALDNDTLAAIREEYAAMQDATQQVADRIARDIVGLVRDLLHLDA